MILTDNETKVDLLNNEAIATRIIKLLRDRPDRPVTIGVHGDWSAGKLSILDGAPSNTSTTKVAVDRRLTGRTALWGLIGCVDYQCQSGSVSRPKRRFAFGCPFVKPRAGRRAP